MLKHRHLRHKTKKFRNFFPRRAMGFRVYLNSIEVSQHHAGERRAKEFDTPFSRTMNCS